jgi:hypothetical protein
VNGLHLLFSDGRREHLRRRRVAKMQVQGTQGTRTQTQRLLLSFTDDSLFVQAASSLCTKPTALRGEGESVKSQKGEKKVFFSDHLFFLSVIFVSHV